MEKREYSFWCMNHETPVKMQISEGVSPFYACPKYYDKNRASNEKKCVNRMTFIDAGGILEYFANVENNLDPFDGVSDLTGCFFIYKGTKSKIEVSVLKYTNKEVRLGVKNVTALKK